MNNKLLIAVTALLVFALTTIPARANVIYDWVPLSQAGHAGLLPIGHIVFTDAAVAGGSFLFSEFCVHGCAPGLPAGLVSIAGPPGSIGPIVLLDINVIFLANGTLSGTTDYNDFGGDFFVDGSNKSWSGVMNSDLLHCHDPNPCQITGFWQAEAIPEPSSLVLLATALVPIGLLILLRRVEGSILSVAEPG